MEPRKLTNGSSRRSSIIRVAILLLIGSVGDATLSRKRTKRLILDSDSVPEPRTGDDPGPGPPSLKVQNYGDNSQLELPVHVHVINSEILDQENSGEWLDAHDDGALTRPEGNHLSESEAQPHRQLIEWKPRVQHTRQWLDTHGDGPLIHAESNPFSGLEARIQHQPTEWKPRVQHIQERPDTHDNERLVQRESNPFSGLGAHTQHQLIEWTPGVQHTRQWLDTHGEGPLIHPESNPFSRLEAHPQHQPIEWMPGVQHTGQWLDTQGEGPLMHPESNTFSGLEAHPQHEATELKPRVQHIRERPDTHNNERLVQPESNRFGGWKAHPLQHPIDWKSGVQHSAVIQPNKEPVIYDSRLVPYENNLEENVFSGTPGQPPIPEINHIRDVDFRRDSPYHRGREWFLGHSIERGPKKLDRPHQHHPDWYNYPSTEVGSHVQQPMVPNVLDTAPSKPLKGTALGHFMKHLLLSALLARHGVGPRESLPVDRSRLTGKGQTIHHLPPQIPIFEKVSPGEVRRTDARRLASDYGRLEKSPGPAHGFGYGEQRPKRKKKKGGHTADK